MVHLSGQPDGYILTVAAVRKYGGGLKASSFCAEVCIYKVEERWCMHQDIFPLSDY